MKTVTIAFANNKGGSGKSTTCANVGYALAAEGKRVLLVDGDMQMNLTLSFMDEEKALSVAQNGQNLYSVIKNDAAAQNYYRLWISIAIVGNPVLEDFYMRLPPRVAKRRESI